MFLLNICVEWDFKVNKSPWSPNDLFCCLDWAIIFGSQAIFPAVIHQHFGHSLFLAACPYEISYPFKHMLVFLRQNPIFPMAEILSLSAFNWHTPSFEYVSFFLPHFPVLRMLKYFNNVFTHSLIQSTNM